MAEKQEPTMAEILSSVRKVVSDDLPKGKLEPAGLDSNDQEPLKTKQSSTPNDDGRHEPHFGQSQTPDSSLKAETSNIDTTTNDAGAKIDEGAETGAPKALKARFPVRKDKSTKEAKGESLNEPSNAVAELQSKPADKSETIAEDMTALGSAAKTEPTTPPTEKVEAKIDQPAENAQRAKKDLENNPERDPGRDLGIDSDITKDPSDPDVLDLTDVIETRGIEPQVNAATQGVVPVNDDALNMGETRSAHADPSNAPSDTELPQNGDITEDPLFKAWLLDVLKPQVKQWIKEELDARRDDPKLSG